MNGITRILLLEGIEASGKTTLGKELEELGWGYVHFGLTKEPDTVAYWLQEITKAVEKSVDGRVVVDRLHNSAMVYGRLCRAVPDISEFDYWVVDGWLKARQTTMIYCMSMNWELSKLRLNEKYRGILNPEELSDNLILESKKSALKRVILSTYRNAGSMDRFYTSLDPVIDESMGSHNPKIWLVGYQHGRKNDAGRVGTTLAGGSGVTLWQALQVAGLTWNEVHLSNAVDDNDVVRELFDKWYHLGFPTVVALGNETSKLLNMDDIPHKKIRHPQHVRRFNYYDIIPYAQDILEAGNG